MIFIEFRDDTKALILKIQFNGNIRNDTELFHIEMKLYYFRVLSRLLFGHSLMNFTVRYLEAHGLS